MHPNWQTNFFHGVALEFWRRAVSPQQTCVEVDFLEHALGITPGSTLLDVPCGSGRHAILLASRCHQLTGVDSSAESIAEARESVVPVRWVLGDMCELPWSEEFQGAYCFGNSFSYLDHEGASRFLKAVAGALRPGGRFVMETGMAAEAILPVLGKGLWHRFGDILVLSENRYHPAESRLDIDYTFIQNGQVETRPSSSYCFTAGEICRLHAAAGLQVLELRDGCTEKPFQLGSRSLVVISQR